MHTHLIVEVRPHFVHNVASGCILLVVASSEVNERVYTLLEIDIL